MLARLVFFGAATLLALKLFAPHKLKAFGKQVDRVVNATLIALGLVYAVQIALYLFSHH